MTMAKTLSRGCLLFTLCGLGLGACAGSRAAAGPPTSFHAVDEIDERPPRLLGADAQLTIHDGVLSGRLDGGAYDVKLTPDAAVGRGPLGRIDVRIRRAGDGYDLAGVWNGGKVHLVVDQRGARGDVVKQISAEDPGYASCHYDIWWLRKQHEYTGLSQCLGDEAPLRFEVRPHRRSDLSDEQNAVLLLAYFAAPPAVRTL
jgi:hypothetical protein